MKQLNNEDSGVFRGTKTLKAWPMTKAEYCEYRGWDKPTDEDGAETGYLVEYLDGGKANDERHSGYISWSPSEVFDKTYHRIDGDATGVNFAVDEAWYAEQRRCKALETAAQIMAGRGSVLEEVIRSAQRYEEFLRGPEKAEEPADNAD